MPPRLAVVTIIALWLCAIGWLIQREMWPVWFPPPHEPPSFAVDLMDEIGRNTTNWKVYLVTGDNEQSVGEGISTVEDKGDGTLEFTSRLRFPNSPILGVGTFIGSSYRVTRAGHLRDLGLKLKFKFPVEIDVTAHVADGQIQPDIRVTGKLDWRMPNLKPIPVPDNGIVLNPAHIGTRLPNLRNGQTWRVPLLDPTDFVPVPGLSGGLGSEMWAEVKEDALTWGGGEVPCFRIDYTQLGKKEVLETSFVRRRDGQVIQQQARMFGLELKLVRVPD